MISDNNGGLPRYCHPFHGGWDVARIALNIPESMILFVCPSSCARIIKLNAINYGYDERIAVLGLTESDIVAGDYEEKTYEAACELMETMEKQPKALIIYVSCIDAMLGNDHTFQTKRIMEKYPETNCFVLKMCPITRYSTELPLVELQNDMYMALPDAVKSENGSSANSENTSRNGSSTYSENTSRNGSSVYSENTSQNGKVVAFIGSNIALEEDNELIKLLKKGGYTPLHIQSCSSYEDYLKVRESVLNICFMPFGRKACENLKARFGTDFYPVYFRHDLDYIQATLTELADKLGITDASAERGLMREDIGEWRREAVDELKRAAADLQSELVLDSTSSLAVMELKAVLEDSGFKVRYVYRDSADTQEPDIDSGHISMPFRRNYGESAERSACTAIGQAAGCFEKAEYTVNMFYDNGTWGYAYLKKLAGYLRKECER